MSSHFRTVGEQPQQEIAVLVNRLHKTQQRLRELIGGEVDSVVHSGGVSYSMPEAEEKLRASEAAQRELAATQSSILNALPAHIALLDHRGVILSVNEGWRQFAENNSLADPSSGVGMNYLDICEGARGQCAGEAREAAVGIRSVLRGASKEFSLDYPCHSPTAQRWFRLIVNPIRNDGRPGAVVMHLDITEGKLAEETMRASDVDMAAAQCLAHFGSWGLDLTETSDLSANTLRWSDEMFRIAGYEPGSVKVSNELFFDLIPEDEHEAIRQAVAEAIRGRGPYSIIHRLIRPDGEERIIHEMAQIFYDETTGRPLKMVGTAQDITERKRAEEKLSASEVLLRLFIEHTPAAIAMLDTQMRYIQASDRWIQDYHLEGREIIGRSHYEIFPDAPQRWKDIHQRVLAGAIERCEEDAFPRADGSMDWLRWEARPWRQAGGEIGGLIFFTQMVTAQKKAEAELSLNEQRYRSLVEATTAIVWDTPASGIFEVEQPSWSAFTGQTFEEYHGWGWLDAVHPDDQAETTRVWSAAVANQSIYAVEHRLRAADQTYRNMQVRGVPLRADDGTIRQWTGIHTDITERKRSEERIAEQASLIDQSQDAIFLRDLKHRVTFWNKGAERLYGWTAAEAVGRFVDELIHSDPPTLLEAVETLRTEDTWAGEMEKSTKAGVKLTLASRWTLVRDARQEPRAILVVDTDITERKQIERQFYRAQRMESIGTLAGGLAHDLNNVLSPILMSLDLLRTKFPDVASKELISILSASARRAADMVEQVLAFARGVEGRQIEVNVQNLIKEIEHIANDTFLKTIRIKSSIPDGLRNVLGDPTQLHQVLLNLCVNARDAMPGGGSLSISARNLMLDGQCAALNPEARPGPYVLLTVEDSGTGMPAALLENIFDPFFTTKEFGKGTGLGLSTSLTIIKGHGGFIQVHSQEGKGTRFQVYLPALTGIPRVKAEEKVVAIERGHGELILVVDDEPSIRLITRQTLEENGYRVVLASDGADAVAIFACRRTEIAAILTDMNMPEMGGLQVIQILRRMEPTVRIIAASGLPDPLQGGHAPGLEANCFLPKPFTGETLLIALQNVLTKV